MAEQRPTLAIPSARQAEVNTFSPECEARARGHVKQQLPGTLLVATALVRSKPLAFPLRVPPSIIPLGEEHVKEERSSETSPSSSAFLLFSFKHKERKKKMQPKPGPWALSEACSASQTNKYIKQSFGRQGRRAPGLQPPALLLVPEVSGRV